MTEAEFCDKYLDKICNDRWRDSIKTVIRHQLMYSMRPGTNSTVLTISERIIESSNEWQNETVKPEYRQIELHRLRNLLQIINHMKRPSRKQHDNYGTFIRGCERALEATNNSIR